MIFETNDYKNDIFISTSPTTRPLTSLERIMSDHQYEIVGLLQTLLLPENISNIKILLKAMSSDNEAIKNIMNDLVVLLKLTDE